MTPAPKRRWPRFSLRTMFVVVAVFACGAGFLSYELSWIQQRREALIPNEVPYSWAESWNTKGHPATAPWHLRILGEGGIAAIWIDRGMPSATREGYRNRLQRLFPEAQVIDAMEKWNQYHPPFSTPPNPPATQNRSTH